MRRLCAACLALCLSRVAEAQYLPPSPYLTIGDSPFATFAGRAYFHLEKFESGAISMPGVIASAGSVLPPAPLTDSVDGDDGIVDGSGSNGWSWYSNGVTNHVFTFDAGVLGQLPDRVGIVATDVGQTTTGPFGIGEFHFRAYDGGGTLIGSGMTFAFGDGSVAGATTEDRFVGIVAPMGTAISRIEVGFDNSLDWEVDHLQYGAVPEPSSMSLGVGLIMAGVHSMRRRARVLSL